MGASQSVSTEARVDNDINSTVNGHQVVIFSKRTCGYCDAVKHLMAREMRQLRSGHQCDVADVKVIELDDEADLQRGLYRRTGVPTVPQVFVNKAFVGGASDTSKMANSGALRMALMTAAHCKPLDKDDDNTQ